MVYLCSIYFLIKISKRQFDSGTVFSSINDFGLSLGEFEHTTFQMRDEHTTKLSCSYCCIQIYLVSHCLIMTVNKTKLSLFYHAFTLYSTYNEMNLASILKIRRDRPKTLKQVLLNGR